MVMFVTSTLEVKENSNKKQVNSKLKSYFFALISLRLFSAEGIKG